MSRGIEMGGVAVYNTKPAISLKRGKIGPRLLLITNYCWVRTKQHKQHNRKLH